jgi:hypothetical protein
MEKTYESPTVKDLGTLQDLTLQNIFKNPQNSDGVIVSGQAVGTS